MPPDDRHERALRSQGYGLVAGLDEVGRGPLAGPVAAAAVILDPRNVPLGLDDSKRLTAETRSDLFEAIMAQALAVGIGFASAAEIDRINIRQATFAAMGRAAAALSVAPDAVIVDGRDVPPGLPCPGRAIVGGDALAVSIAAASIVAKVVRDRLMERLDRRDPRYGFARHKGYGTPAHRAALLRHGPSPAHRRSFGLLAVGALSPKEG